MVGTRGGRGAWGFWLGIGFGDVVGIGPTSTVVDIAWSILLLSVSVQDLIFAFPSLDSYSSTASMSDRVVRVYLNSGRLSREFIGTGSKLHSSRRARISFSMMYFIIRSSRTVYVSSIFQFCAWDANSSVFPTLVRRVTCPMGPCFRCY